MPGFVILSFVCRLQAAGLGISRLQGCFGLMQLLLLLLHFFSPFKVLSGRETGERHTTTPVAISTRCIRSRICFRVGGDPIKLDPNEIFVTFKATLERRD